MFHVKHINLKYKKRIKRGEENMSYPQFNLTTLQLPAPASNMTKAEYKAAYGIDLDEVNIKAFKLVLLGNEKYPIDKIKVIEDGYEIYFNGRILSITDIIQTSDEVYDVANAKPIYIHPIALTLANDFRAGIFIFDNSPTPYNKDTLIAKIQSIADLETGGIARIIMTGAISINEVILPISYLAYIKASSQFQLFAGNTSQTFSVDQLKVFITSVNDGVNKIN